jgi:hypothetical protein
MFLNTFYRPAFILNTTNMTMDNVQKYNICINVLSL